VQCPRQSDLFEWESSEIGGLAGRQDTNIVAVQNTCAPTRRQFESIARGQCPGTQKDALEQKCLPSLG
jgi:hypothetical protein